MQQHAAPCHTARPCTRAHASGTAPAALQRVPAVSPAPPLRCYRNRKVSVHTHYRRLSRVLTAETVAVCPQAPSQAGNRGCLQMYWLQKPHGANRPRGSYSRAVCREAKRLAAGSLQLGSFLILASFYFYFFVDVSAPPSPTPTAPSQAPAAPGNPGNLFPP